MNKIKKLLILFITFLKIGLFTFGGGYAMIAVVESEVVEKKKWLEKSEFLDIIAIAESTPGPIAINMATFVGYNKQKFFGALLCTLGVILPSFVIIFVISLFFDKFLSLQIVQYAFRGIQCAVAFLILKAGIKMLKSIEKDILSTVLLSLTVIALMIFNLFAVNFSSVFLILIGGVLGIIAYLIGRYKSKLKEKK